jgi:hypothetical protein
MNCTMVALLVSGCLNPIGVAVPPDSSPSTRPASYVQPIDFARLRSRLNSLPPAQRELVDLYAEAARRDVLTQADGCVPDTDYRTHYRNLAERAKGAAVLAMIAPSWPEELRQRCRREATAFVREVALHHRAVPNMKYEWQVAFWVGEAAIAGWFLWDDLDADVRDAVAEMVVYQADRFIGVRPKMGYQLDTQAETVSWNSSILTLAVNMMPAHPHHVAWDHAAKQYIYNTFAVPQDAADARVGDDGRMVGDWIVGANLYPDLTLENHRQFHIDYVLAAYRFHVQGAAMYWLTGRPLPAAFHHRVRGLYDKVLRRCMTADGFFVYVSDNDWKRYHCWAESCSIHAYLAMLEENNLAASLERRALHNAMSLWRAMPKDYAYENQYACGKAWTSRIADAVLMHIACPSAAPAPLPDAQVDSQLQGTMRLDTPELLTHFGRDGRYASCCKGKGDDWVCYAAPREDAWLFLPVASNYRACVKGKPVIGKAATRFGRGPDWFWTVRQGESGRSGEAFVSLPDGTAIYAQHVAAADLPKEGVVENSIAVEKSHVPLTIHYANGQARWQPGQPDWQLDASGAGLQVPGNWLNLYDRMGVVVASCSPDAKPDLQLPKPGVRDRVALRTKLPVTADQSLFIVLLPDKDHRQTETAAKQISATSSGAVMMFTRPRGVLVINFGPAKATVTVPAPVTAGSVELEPANAGLWLAGGRVF